MSDTVKPATIVGECGCTLECDFHRNAMETQRFDLDLAAEANERAREAWAELTRISVALGVDRNKRLVMERIEALLALEKQVRPWAH